MHLWKLQCESRIKSNDNTLNSQTQCLCCMLVHALCSPCQSNASTEMQKRGQGSIPGAAAGSDQSAALPGPFQASTGRQLRRSTYIHHLFSAAFGTSPIRISSCGPRLEQLIEPARHDSTWVKTVSAALRDFSAPTAGSWMPCTIRASRSACCCISGTLAGSKTKVPKPGQISQQLADRRRSDPLQSLSQSAGSFRRSTLSMGYFFCGSLRV